MTSPIQALRFAFATLLAGVFVASHNDAAAADTRLEDLQGKAAKPFGDRNAKLVAFVFARSDCPISNAYAPEVRRLCEEFAPQGVVFWLVYPGADESPAVIRKHARDYAYPCGALRDPRHAFTKVAKVSVTPEAAVFRPDGKLLYSGRIDDRYVDLGVAKPKPTRRDLSIALGAALAGRPVPRATGPAIGCFIEAAE
jgi:hypothetical protein